MKNSLYIVHRLPGRVRFFVPQIYKCQERARLINRVLLQMEGINYVRVNPLSGRVLVFFNEDKLSLKTILYFLAREKIWMFYSKREVFKYRPQTCMEPEDLPLFRQLFNVALGGGVLVLLIVKRLTVGKSRLAGSVQLFYLAAFTALISGYPIIKSGISQLNRGRVNHDLIMSTISLITILLRESIPGLTLIWLVNLTALIQTLVYQMAQRAVGTGEENYTGQVSVAGDAVVVSTWERQAMQYGANIVPLITGMAGVIGLSTGSFDRCLAMLLAASPAPAGLSASFVQTAALTGALSRGIIIKDLQTLPKVTRINCLLLPENYPRLKELKSLGIQRIITVGDRLLQDERLNLVQKNKAEDKVVAYVGRKNSDLSALRAADVSLTYTASEPGLMNSAGVFLTKEGPEQLLELWFLAFKAEENFHRNLFLVHSLNLLGLGLGAAGKLSPIVSTFYNNLISIFTAVNSLLFGLSLRNRKENT